MRPMSLYESKESTKEVSFKDILDGKDISGVSIIHKEVKKLDGVEKNQRKNAKCFKKPC